MQSIPAGHHGAANCTIPRQAIVNGHQHDARRSLHPILVARETPARVGASKERATMRPDVVHPVWLRRMHWINAAAMTIMVLSGWQIYDASPIFPFRFSHSITLGGWLGGGLLWHLARMWLLMLHGALYLVFAR